MSYVQESGASMARRRRRRRAAITLSVIAVLLLGAAGYAAAYFQGWVGAPGQTPAATSTCRAARAVVTPKSVTLNVYNATNRNGLAARVSTTLRTQGFSVASVRNDPLTKTIAGTGEIRHGKAGLAAAKLVATRLTSAKLVQDGRTDGSVDLVLGNTFRALAAPRAAPKPAPVKSTSGRPTSTATAAC